MPNFGDDDITVWTTGKWTSPTLDVSTKNMNNASLDREFTFLIWLEQETEDEDVAYVRVELLDSSGTVLHYGLEGSSFGGEGYKRIVLEEYADVKGSDCKVRFRLYSLTKSPIVSNIEVV